MTLQPTHIVVAGTGDVYVAPENTPAPADLAELADPWAELGYCDEDGVTFTFSREQEDVNAWQSAEPVRVLITSEPKTIAFNLLEFDRDSILLAFRGGAFSGSAAPYTYTPPDSGTLDVRALVIDGVDGGQTFRFYFPRVQLSGDVEFQLVRTDAVTLSIELSVLASPTKWIILSDLPGFGAEGTMLAASSEDLSALTRAQLDEKATALGLNPSDYATKDDEVAAIQEAQTAAPATA
jgi:hypothetical protein